MPLKRILSRLVSVMILSITLFITLASVPVAAWNSLPYVWRLQDVQPLYYWVNPYISLADKGAFYSGAYNWTSPGTPVEFYCDQYNYLVLCTTFYDSQTNMAGYCPLAWADGYMIWATPQINKYYTDGYSSNRRLSVASHELGHSAGLDHESGAVLMNGDNDYIWNLGIYTPQQDDIDGLNAIY